MQTLLSSSRYKSFVKDRDRALSWVNINAQVDLSRLTYTMLAQIENFSAAAAIRSGDINSSTQFETGVKDIMTHFFPLFVHRILRLRHASFVLSYAGEQEAIGRATKWRPHISRGQFTRRIKDEMAAPTLLGPLDKRIWLCLMKLRHDVVAAYELAVAQELTPIEIVDKVKAAFPPIKVYKRPPMEIKPIKESHWKGDELENENSTDSYVDFDFIDDAEWDSAVDAYLNTSIPPNRFDNSGDWDPSTNTMRYEWELEQESTEDFVRSVRSGQVAGAEDLGVKDFVWVAILDDKTCEVCCAPRNGLTTSEIEDLDDDCEATVPPAHFNCRCNIAPVASVDEVEGPDWGSFNDWAEGEMSKKGII